MDGIFQTRVQSDLSAKTTANHGTRDNECKYIILSILKTMFHTTLVVMSTSMKCYAFNSLISKKEIAQGAISFAFDPGELVGYKHYQAYIFGMFQA